MATDSLRVKNSANNIKNGRYTLGGQTEVSAFALEWWNRITISYDPTDLVYVMEKKYEGKPQLLGYLFYGDEGLWWVVATYNNIMDPLNELVEGKVLLIPTLERLRQELFTPNVTPGGIPSKRVMG